MLRSLRLTTYVICLTGLWLLIIPTGAANAETIANRLSGRILLQVQSQGEAWYVYPVNKQRYYLGRPADAFTVMRSLGLGVSENDYKTLSKNGAPKLSGRILLRVQATGEAYYVNPTDQRLYYLGRPADAFAVMRRFGLGVSNQDLDKITPFVTATSVAPVQTDGSHVYTWTYQNKSYHLNANLSSSLYQSYSSSSKVFTYYVGQEPADMREAFYGLFLKVKTEDNQTGAVLASLRRQAADLGLTSDQTVAFIMAFIQYLPYDHAKIESGSNTPYYPFETLYLQKGVCADKSFLAVLWLRSLGYGAAILDFPESNHSAAGVACPIADSLSSSGYCYIETTNYFPVGIVPPAIKNGQADNREENLADLFKADQLGRMDIKQKSAGKIYQGITNLKAEVSSLQTERLTLNASQLNLKQLSVELDDAYQSLREKEAVLLGYKSAGDWATYNSLVAAYNDEVAAYQVQASAYEQAVSAYNGAVTAFNQHYRSFYQQ